MVLTSAFSKQVLLVELSVPWEDHMEEANERKRLKDHELVEQCWKRGWKARCEPIEVGCGGFADHSLCKVFSLLGITGAAKRESYQVHHRGCRESLWVDLDKKVRNLGQCCWDTSQGLINPGWVA